MDTEDTMDGEDFENTNIVNANIYIIYNCNNGFITYHQLNCFLNSEF